MKVADEFKKYIAELEICNKEKDADIISLNL
jgi:hypothetical protein